MNYVLKGHNMVDDVVSMLMMFYPNEKYVQVDSVCEDRVLVSEISELSARAFLYKDGVLISSKECVAENKSQREIKRVLGLSIARCINEKLNIPLPWGILTGVRPAKLVSEAWEKGESTESIRKTFKEKYFVSDEKLELMIRVANEEKKIVENGYKKAGLYIGIPFCPTRCLYCSFTSYPLKQYNDRVDRYVDALIKEMESSKKFLDGIEIESIYIGGGTPTSLNERQLEKLLNSVEKNFKIPLEYTVEAGRPDTINEEKLKILKDHNVSRLSINPQTLNEKTLKLIGREHSVDMFLNVYELARKVGHKHINTDIILGLPEEGEKEVIATMEGLEKLSPESITVHTLAVKRASRLKETLENYSMTEAEKMDKLINISREYTEKMDMLPYYMYRQKNMVGNFENVGYCKENCQCIYNVAIMEEKQSILALGAGASTKLLLREKNQIERVFNVKSVDDYINRIDEMIERKNSAIKGVLPV